MEKAKHREALIHDVAQAMQRFNDETTMILLNNEEVKKKYEELRDKFATELVDTLRKDLSNG